MKNRFLYIALSLISVLTSCKDDEFEPLNNVAECTWHVSTDQENVSPIQLNLNNYISIMDLSQGMLSRIAYYVRILSILQPQHSDFCQQRTIVIALPQLRFR
jgi:hypothetical protein